MLSISFQSHLIKCSGTGCTFKDIQRLLRHLRHLESTWAFGHSEGTQALGHVESTQRALGHSGTLGTWALRHLGHSGTQALRDMGTQALRDLGTQGTQTLGHSGTRELEHSRHFIQQTCALISSKKYFVIFRSEFLEASFKPNSFVAIQ